MLIADCGVSGGGSVAPLMCQDTMVYEGAIGCQEGMTEGYCGVLGWDCVV